MRRVVVALAVVVAGFVVVPQVAVGALMERVSVAADGGQANGSSSTGPAISADGRYVAFDSDASNLVPGDTNRVSDVFVRDLRSGTIQRVSVATDGTQANNSSVAPAISADGRYVVFSSFASNLVPGDTNGGVFVRDLRSGTTRLVSVGADAGQDNNNNARPSISADGRYVAFNSNASNLVPGDTNSAPDVFVRDLRSGTIQRVSVAADGGQANDSGGGGQAISADGRYVVFVSDVSHIANNCGLCEDVFVRDLRSGTTRRVSVAADGGQANEASGIPAISADGRYVTFFSGASNLVPGARNGGVFVRDLRLGTTRQVDVAGDGGQPNGTSDCCSSPAISADGRYVAFWSDASNLVPGDTNGAFDVFVRDLRSGTTRLVSVGADGFQGNKGSAPTAISADGRYVAFNSDASNLVPGDTNHRSDVFVRDLSLEPPPPSNKFTVSRIKAEADGAITFSVHVPGPGSVDVLATAWNDNLASAAVLLKPARHRFVFARAHVPAARHTLKVTVTPNQRGRLLVAHPRYRIVLRLWVSYTPYGGRYRTIGYLGLHLPDTCANHDTVAALRSRTVVRCT